MIYVFYALMGISALIAIPSFLGVLTGVFFGAKPLSDPGYQNREVSLIEFLLSAALFCLAAICVQLWQGFPGF